MTAEAAGARPRIVTCHQPTYLPWPGLFHKLAVADALVLMDTVAYSRTGWQNRNRIKGPGGWFWLTVPLDRARSGTGRLDEVALPDGGPGVRRGWQERHWTSLRQCYARAPYWKSYAPAFEEIYRGRSWSGLTELNIALLRLLLRLLGIDVELLRASELGGTGRKSRLVLDHCRRAGGTIYVSGVNGHDYLREREFTDAGVSVFYQGYRPPRYAQRHGPFVPGLSVVDLLFNVGPGSAEALLAGNVPRSDIAAAAAAGPAVLESAADAAGAPRVAVRGPSARPPASRPGLLERT